MRRRSWRCSCRSSASSASWRSITRGWSDALVTITNCARNGALFLSNQASYSTYYANVTAAATADAGSLSPTPTVSYANYTDSYGNSCVTVTVSYTFTTFVNYPGIPHTSTLSSSISMPVNN